MRVLLNPKKLEFFRSSGSRGNDIYNFHKTLPGYAPTPLISVPAVAENLGIRNLLVKDEGKRFGLKAFKALGASYAVFQVLKERSGESLKPEEFLTDKGRHLAEGVTFTCATDGNHGRAVAWIARLLERPAVIFMPGGSVPARITAIESEGARVVVVDGGYDEAVRCAAQEGKKENRLVIADTGYPGYMKIPRFIQEGYLTMFWEIDYQLTEKDIPVPDVVCVQAGVGAFASAAALFYADPQRGPRLLSVEPTAADCLFHSSEVGDGEPHTTESMDSTIMAGLHCETPSRTAWPLVRDRFDAFVSMEDHYAERAMRELGRRGIVSGESGAAGLAALFALREERPDFLEKDLKVNSSTGVLVINTEADTDPEGYYRVVGKSAADIEGADVNA